MSEIQVPFLSEHEGPRSDGAAKPGYTPTPEEKKTIQLVDRLFERAKKHRKKYDQHWNDYYRMFRGKQWKESRPSYRHSEVVNIIFQTIQSMVPTLTDSKPKIEFLPTVQSQYELADILTKVSDNDWAQNNWLMILTEILFDSHFYSAAFGYWGHDPKANLGLGNILFESWDPFYCYPDPDARDVNERRSKFFVYAEPVALSQLKKEFPHCAQYITPDVIEYGQGKRGDVDNVTYRSPMDSRLVMEGQSPTDSLSRDQALKITLYLKDDQFEEIEEDIRKEDGTPILDDEGNPKTKFIQKLKYPNGRKIVTAGGVLLEDGPLEFEDGQFPVVKHVNYILPREFFGMGEVEQLEGPQKTLNKLVSYALDVLTLMGNPVWKVGTSANIDTDNLINKPGLVIEADDITQVQREPGVELQPFVFSLIDRFKTYMDGISGETDLSRGVEPADVTAASAIRDLQQAQQTRLRLKSRNIDVFLQQSGKLYLSRVFQYYSVPRIVRVSGNENASQYFQFHVETLDQPDGTKKRLAHVTTWDEVNTPSTVVHEITGDFDVRVSTGSALPFAKEAKQQISFNLFKLGVIDDEELLKNLDYPNYESVLQRMNEKRARMAQEQAMAQAQGGAPVSGPPAPPAA